MTAKATNKKNTPKRMVRDSTIQWRSIEHMRVSPRAQRAQRKSHIENIAANFDPNKFGLPTINIRDGQEWIVDGGHRVEGMRLMGWGNQQMQCFVYEGLTEQEEAEMFLVLNNIKPVTLMQKFKVSVVAERSAEVEIDMIVQSLGLHVGGGEGGINAVGVLNRIYASIGPDGLLITLKVLLEAYGDHGFKSTIIDGIGLVIGSYGNVDEDQLIARLANARGGLAGLTNKAAVIKESTGVAAKVSIAAAAVDMYNYKSTKDKRIVPWFKANA